MLAVQCATVIAFTGCKVTAPGKTETAVVQWTKYNVTVGGKRDRNPVKDTVANTEEGKRIFGYYRVVGHGRDGQHSAVPVAANMSPPIPLLASQEVQQYNDGRLKWIIENRISPSGLPASRGILSDDDIWAIVVYLRHLPPAGSLGEPRAYSGDEFGTDSK